MGLSHNLFNFFAPITTWQSRPGRVGLQAGARGKPGGRGGPLGRVGPGAGVLVQTRPPAPVTGKSPGPHSSEGDVGSTGGSGASRGPALPWGACEPLATTRVPGRLTSPLTSWPVGSDSGLNRAHLTGHPLRGHWGEPDDATH